MLTKPFRTSAHLANESRRYGSQRNYLGGRPGNAALSPDAWNIEAVAAGLRQALDLLLADNADARRYPRSSDHHDPGRDRAIRAAARRRTTMGHRAFLCDPGPPGRNSGSFSDRPSISCRPSIGSDPSRQFLLQPQLARPCTAL